ncbi:hypothetical protein CPB83DRAFT_777975 [Crepidotus variabilis]|uniref:Uncharacterized protein n=1 Tax=Crepidotus variabilis TaxID=179855 RepID=A0A9P6E3M0_9AGAR|nr:hypothetical protein CPB83DRAFT_777975 [Crepidotus variabilis]
MATLALKGVIYLGDRHFVTRFIDSNKKIWCNDGITTGEICEPTGSLGEISEKDLKKMENATAVMAIYTAQ